GHSRGFCRISRIEAAAADNLRLHQREEVVIDLIRYSAGRLAGRPRLRAFRKILARSLPGTEGNRGGHRYGAHAAALAKARGELPVEIARSCFVVPLDFRVQGEEERVIHPEARIDSPGRLKSPDAVG